MRPVQTPKEVSCQATIHIWALGTRDQTQYNPSSLLGGYYLYLLEFNVGIYNVQQYIIRRDDPVWSWERVEQRTGSKLRT